MPHNAILEAIASTPTFGQLLDAVAPRHKAAVVGGATGSLAGGILGALHQAQEPRALVAVAASPTEAAGLEADFEALLGEGVARLYPQREALPYEAEEPHLEIGGLRVEALEALFGRRTRLLVTTLRALQERAPIPDRLATLRTTVRVSDDLGLTALATRLRQLGFERVPLVEQVGQYAVRGGILDVFSFGSLEPMRIEFWGDEVASIRYFDILDQLSTRQTDSIHILPVDFRSGDGGGNRVHRSLLEVLPADTLLCVLEPQDWDGQLRRTWEEVVEFHGAEVRHGRRPVPPQDVFLEPTEARAHLGAFACLELRRLMADAPIAFDAEAAEPIERDMARLDAVLRAGAAREEHTLILCDNEGQLDRLEEILGGPERLPPGVQLAVGTVAEGFVLREARPPLRILTDHEIFRRTRRLRQRRQVRGAVALESLAQLRPGDYVVHMDHGVGRFRGLERIEAGGADIEALAIEYHDAEILRVPVYRLDLVERWVGESEEAEPPPVDKIGGRRWKRVRRRTEQAVEKVALELLELYADREMARGFAFSADSRWQREMESAFLYEDTPDQRRSAGDVKRDMEAPRPMDRLLCGDVGYGKTEVAIRAAFKAVQDGKQVAVLAPTTILVEQHLHTFSQRLAGYPVHIAALSRFRPPSEQRAIIATLAAGTLDIVIGTHRLLRDDVRFHDLGLVVIDEEQRFGVRHKERLKALRRSVDVLTLTATPIPRTLYLSMSGLRDLSLIQTPPRDRMPIITHVLPWSDEILRDALRRELDRGGQVFFLHNRVDTIGAAKERVHALVPEARLGVAHGQMPSRELDHVMREFLEGRVDVLICSSIIENGLDVPSANTLIVDRADRFGLAQLYQIRGRVGRSDRRAYCYLAVPETLSDEAERRLRVLEHYTELGSGYAIALRDLELRGAGNILGREQSGFAHAVGLDTYLRLLERTVRRLRGGREAEEYPDPEISLSGAAYLPDDYISDSGQKLHFYRRISKLRHVAEVETLRRELADRFGPQPPEVERLLAAGTLRVLGRQIGVERLSVQNREARINFRPRAAPRLTPLEAALRNQQIDVEVRRLEPLSVTLHSRGPEVLTSTVIRALTAWVEHRAVAA
ncbi:MAG: transcription-repair coupling factor [Gemmatimonadetes bacterium]|nr:transcription-repair coupling factor [Gemmatimonadota bacterium]